MQLHGFVSEKMLQKKANRVTPEWTDTSGNTCRKTPFFFNSRDFVEKHCNGP